MAAAARMASVWRTDFTCQEPGPPPSHGPHTLIDSESNFTHLEVQRKAFLLFRPALGQVSVPARHAMNSICCSAKKSCSDNSSTMFTRPHPPTPTHAHPRRAVWFGIQAAEFPTVLSARCCYFLTPSPSPATTAWPTC